MLNTKNHNRIIAELLEPDPPKISEDSPSAWIAATTSPNRGWYQVTLYEEGDVPRWEPRVFTNSFDAAMEAYEELRGNTIELHKDNFGWEASEYVWDEDIGEGDTAAEAIVSLIIGWDDF